MILDKQKKQTVILLVSTFLSTILGVLASVLNTHFLTPSDYGDVKYVQNIVSLVCVFLLFGYFLSGSRLLALSKDENKSRNIRGLLMLILLVTFVTGILMLVGCYMFYTTTYCHLFIIAILLCGSSLISNYVNTVSQGDNHIGRIAVTRFLPSAVYVLVAYLFFTNFEATSSSMLLLYGGVNAVITLAIIISTKPTFQNLSPLWQELQQENRNYGFQLYLGSLAMVATNYLAGLIISYYDGNNVNVGFYTLALTVTTPLTYLPSTIGTTYFKRFASLNSIPPEIMLVTGILTIGCCITFILLIKYVIAFLYPDSYAPVATYSVCLAISFSFHGVGDMLNRFLGSHGIGRPIRNASFANGFAKILGFIILIKFYGIGGAVLTQMLCSLVYAVWMCVAYRQITKKKYI